MPYMIPVAMSEADLIETLEDLGLPLFGSGFVADPAAALRRKNVTAEIEEEIYPVLSRIISDAEVEELSEVDRDWFESNEYDEDYALAEYNPSSYEIYLFEEFGLFKD